MVSENSDPSWPAVRARLSRMDIRFARTVGRTGIDCAFAGLVRAQIKSIYSNTFSIRFLSCLHTFSRGVEVSRKGPSLIRYHRRDESRYLQRKRYYCAPSQSAALA